MGTNSVNNNNIFQNNSVNKKSKMPESYILRQTDDELMSELSNNKKIFELPSYESSSQLFGKVQNSQPKNPSEIFGLEKKSQNKTSEKNTDINTKIKNHIAKIIKDDENRGNSKYSPEQISTLIVKTAEKYKVDPLIVASIAKQETHFTQELSNKNGKGMMQITTIALKDMYIRSDIYGKEVKPLLDKYGTYDKLLKAAKSNPAVNIEVGTALFKAKLSSAKGNLTKALQNYNGSSLKISYAKNVQKYYNEMKK